MIAPILNTENAAIRLIEPDVQRDAQWGVEWLDGQTGYETLQLMGVGDKDNKPTTLEREQARVQSFIDRRDQLNWMIQLDGKIVGSVWVDLQSNDNLPAPGIHIMIGDLKARGRGVGSASFSAVIGYLQKLGYQEIFTRHLSTNTVAGVLSSNSGFTDFGDPYSDTDGLCWQNMKLTVV